ncbi:unnamed protein product [Choristocarpus tenellus]
MDHEKTSYIGYLESGASNTCRKGLTALSILKCLRATRGVHTNIQGATHCAKSAVFDFFILPRPFITLPMHTWDLLGSKYVLPDIPYRSLTNFVLPLCLEMPNMSGQKKNVILLPNSSP